MPEAGDKIISTPVRLPTPFWKIVIACLFVWFLTGLTFSLMGLMLGVLEIIGGLMALAVTPCAAYVFALMTRPLVGDANRTIAKACLLGLLFTGILLVIVLASGTSPYPALPFLALFWPFLSITIARLMDAGQLFTKDRLRDDFFRSGPPADQLPAKPPPARWSERFPPADTAAVMSLPFHFAPGPLIGLLAFAFEQGSTGISSAGYAMSMYAFHFLLFVPGLSFLVCMLFFRAATRWRHFEVIAYSAGIALGIIAAGGVAGLIEFLRYRQGFYYPLNPLGYQVIIAPITTFFVVLFLSRRIEKRRAAGTQSLSPRL